jgi:hypothetical protein
LTCLYQRNDLELYISIAKCLSEMTDEGVNQVSQITKVLMCSSMHCFIIEIYFITKVEVTHEELLTVSSLA